MKAWLQGYSCAQSSMSISGGPRNEEKLRTGDSVRNNCASMAVDDAVDARIPFVYLAVDVPFDVACGSVAVNRSCIRHIVLHQVLWGSDVCGGHIARHDKDAWC